MAINDRGRRGGMENRSSSEPLTRRQALFRAANGFGGLALSCLLSQWTRRVQAASGAVPVAPNAKAQRVIFLFMEGGPSHVDTFDPKPRLAKENGEPMKMELPIRIARERVLMSPFKFHPHGESGTPISELFPHVARHVDKLAIIRSMVSEHADHGSANSFLHTGTAIRGRPSVGSWVNYGLGSECEDLPGYIVLSSGVRPSGGVDCLGNGFLPARFQPSILRKGSQPVVDLEPRDPAAALQRSKLAAIHALNRESARAAGGNDEIEALIANYELAFRMQSALPDALAVGNESPATRALYGIDQKETEVFGTQCLRARKLIERGVRFVQLFPPQPEGMERWDQHFGLAEGHRMNAVQVDRPIAGLLHDLSERGLLADTIVLWGGEFGRTPTGETSSPEKGVGRDHNPGGFSMWLAGGGIRGGIVHGATDEYGYRAVEKPVTVFDLHATILALLGIDHTALTFRHAGRDFRLTDVYGTVVNELIA